MCRSHEKGHVMIEISTEMLLQYFYERDHTLYERFQIVQFIELATRSVEKIFVSLVFLLKTVAW